MSTTFASDAPITQPHLFLVTGGRGAGKSALIQHLLDGAGDARVAYLLGTARSNLVWYGGAAQSFDKIVVELPAAADPVQYRRDEDAASALPAETVITVVDAGTLLADFCSQELIRSRVAGLESTDLRSVADALTDQIEAADVLVLNKVDRVNASQRRGLEALLTVLNPAASLMLAEFGRLPLGALLRDAPANPPSVIVPGWKRALDGQAFPNADELGISSLVYRERRPFHPQRLHAFFGEAWPGAVRSRGIFWLASRPEWVGEVSQAGAARRYRANTTWWASSLAGGSFAPDEVSRFLGVPWHPRFGDRRQEFVFVGIGLDAAGLKHRLDACLLTDEELARDVAHWRSFEDPFPLWGDAEHARRAGAVH
jgi:G3E family GTPase